jgi:hypothetical protein
MRATLVGARWKSFRSPRGDASTPPLWGLGVPGGGVAEFSARCPPSPRRFQIGPAFRIVKPSPDFLFRIRFRARFRPSFHAVPRASVNLHERSWRGGVRPGVGTRRPTLARRSARDWLRFQGGDPTAGDRARFALRSRRRVLISGPRVAFAADHRRCGPGAEGGAEAEAGWEARRWARSGSSPPATTSPVGDALGANPARRITLPAFSAKGVDRSRFVPYGSGPLSKGPTERRGLTSSAPRPTI